MFEYNKLIFKIITNKLYKRMSSPAPISFPTLNIFCCPRFYKGLIVADGRMPLTKYIPKIVALDDLKVIQDDTP
jgi:hypothetical protein